MDCVDIIHIAKGDLMQGTNTHFEPDEFHETASSGRALPRVFLIVAAIAGVWLFRHMQPSSAWADGGWLTDWNQAVQVSKSSGKPAVVLFTADWCGACREFESETLHDDRVRDYLKANHTLVVVDLSDRSGSNSERAAESRVRSIPTIVLYNTAGMETARSHGMGPDDLIDWLRSNR